MFSSKRYVVGSAILALTFVGGRAFAQGPGPASVVVTNNGGSATNPVRVIGPNGGSVPVVGTVDISGTPTVSISGTPTVQIGNTATAPALVRDVSNPANLPSTEIVQGKLDQCFLATEIVIPTIPGGPGGYDVPALKRLILQHASAIANLKTPGQKLTLSLNVYSGGSVLSQHFLVPTPLGSFATGGGPTEDLLEAAGPLVMYADAGTRVQFSSRRSSDTDIGCVTVSFTGYLVPMP